MYVEIVVYFITDKYVPKCQRIPSERTDKSKFRPFSSYLMKLFYIYHSIFVIITMMTPTPITAAAAPPRAPAITATASGPESAVAVPRDDEIQVKFTLIIFISYNFRKIYTSELVNFIRNCYLSEDQRVNSLITDEVGCCLDEARARDS